MRWPEQPWSSWQSGIALLLLISVGALFVLKYSSRVTTFPFIAALGYACAVVLVYATLLGIRAPLAGRISSRQILLAVAALAALLCIGLEFMPVETRTTRFIALNEWWDDVAAGRYPYNHVGGASGFTGLFLIALPFRILGDFGYMQVAGLLLFGLLLVRFARTAQDALLQLTMLLLLPSFHFENLVRSEVFFNMSLCLALIFAAENWGIRFSARGAFLAFALAFGLVLSTRTIVASIFAIYLLYHFRGRIGELIVFSLTVGVVFVMSVLPLVVWNPESFFRYGPFAIQLSYLPSWAALSFVALSCVAGWKAASLREVIFLTGCILFAMTAASLAVYIGRFGWNESLFGERFDISYFVFCTPFLLLSLTLDPSAWRAVSAPPARASVLQ